ncbi:MAG: DUF4381 domain-containing protein [Gammaproteobacteria bacterium]|nr:DUF4381 domain-containing protein [Gammaproteobacteria bacterium]
MVEGQLPLRDLHLPEPVGWWPLAPGWWVLIAIAVVALGWLLARYLKYRARAAARRHALHALDNCVRAYTKHGDAIRLSAELSELLRRTMLAYAPRADVAGLTGEDWLAWLDTGLDRSHFVNGDGRPLIEWPYQRPNLKVPRSDVAALVDAVRLRLSTPVAGGA